MIILVIKKFEKKKILNLENKNYSLKTKYRNYQLSCFDEIATQTDFFEDLVNWINIYPKDLNYYRIVPRKVFSLEGF